ncbi:hypothetical protein B0H10DRAFT_2222960 [Mycena sp. CBHHK59/15]|nr:hypothetical protein B0H10DRAFT_2222960 [Mycena sp. CBHHK59/15]
MKGLTEYRCSVKTCVFKALTTLEDDQEGARLCAKECKPTQENNFWLHVDKKIELYRKIGTTPDELQILFNQNYEKDTKLYGEPDAAIPVTMMQDVEEWLAQLEAAV